MADTLKCPNCGAPLDYTGNDPIIRCPYCSTSVVVPDNLRAKPEFSSKPHNFTLTGMGDMGALVQKAQRIKEVRDLARAGKTIEAIKLYREITDSSLTDAKAAVEALQRGQPVMLSGLSGTGLSGAESFKRAQDSFASAEQHFGQAQQSFSQPQQFTSPAVIQTSATSGSNRMGCLVGCFFTVVAVFIIGVVVFFAAGGLGVVNSLTGLNLSIPSFTYATQELAFGSKGSGPGLFTDVRALAVNPSTGAMFAADYEGGRVQSFDPAGKFIKQWTVGNGKNNSIVTSMAAGHNGNIFLVSEVKVFEYDANGTLVKALPLPGDNFANSVAVGADGTVVVGCDNDVIVILNPDGNVVNTITGAFANNGGTDELDVRVAVDGLGNIYALGTFNNAVFKFNPQGKFINRFGSEGDNQGQFRAPDAVAVDGYGRVYVSDFKGIQVFDANGLYLTSFDPGGAVFGMAFDDQGKLYATSNSQTVYRFNIQKPSTGN